jgi:hypothetical protein
MSALELLSAVAALAALIGLLVALNHLEPHWASRDGYRFISRAQFIDERGLPHGRWHDYRFFIDRDGSVEAQRRGLLGLRHRSYWTVWAKSDEIQRRKLVFALRSTDNEILAVRVPPKSRAVPVLEQFIESHR